MELWKFFTGFFVGEGGGEVGILDLPPLRERGRGTSQVPSVPEGWDFSPPRPLADLFWYNEPPVERDIEREGHSPDRDLFVNRGLRELIEGHLS